MQDLVELAEPIRQCEVSKNTLKTVLWSKLLERLQELPDMQTTDIPQKTSHSGKKKKDKWVPDAMWKHISMMNPDFTDQQIAVEQVVEEHCVDFFQNLGSSDILIKRREGTRSKEVQDHIICPVCVFACMHPCIQAWHSHCCLICDLVKPCD